MSQASDKQKRINELLNASHNSQAERDYLRGQILKIFEEDEKALEDMAKNVPPRQRKQSLPDIRQRDEGFDEESETEFLKRKRKENFSHSNTTSGLGSDDLQSRGSLQFIDVKDANKVGTRCLKIIQKVSFNIASKATFTFWVDKS